MKRHIDHPCPPEPLKAPEQAGTCSATFIIHLVTPLFGGGVEPGSNDPVTLIRGPSIRGQLRFWWRATRGAAFANPKELRAQEGRIWGTTTHPSPVVVEVVETQAFAEDQQRWPVRRSHSRGGVTRVPSPHDHFPAYALFPFQGEPRKIQLKATFEIRVSWSIPIEMKKERAEDISKDVNAALWAWVNFGGLGARTRRGCGALYCEALSPGRTKDINEWYVEKLREFGIPVDEPAREWPTLPPRILMHPEEVKCFQAWNQVVSLLQKFRQAPGIGRNPGSGKTPGRSRWPEPESIREISREQKRLSRRPSGQKPRQDGIPVHYFPRAEFGMPIKFENLDAGLKPTLQPAENVSRMTSPVILKPLALSKEKAFPLILCLKTKPLRSAILKGEGLKSVHSVDESQIRNKALSKYPKSPMASRTTGGSALEAFLSFAKEKKQGFEEVG